MCLASPLRMATAQHLTVRANDDAAHAGVGRGEVKRVMGQAEGLLHEGDVVRRKSHGAIMNGQLIR